MIARVLSPFARLLDILIPARCAGCGIIGGVYCDACDASFTGLPGIVCPSNGATPPVVALGAYDGPLRAAVLSIKFRGLRPAAKRLGRWLAPHVRWSVSAIVPVPLHPQRHRERGYNQALEIARGIADVRSVALLEGALVRARATAPQSGLDRRDRGPNVSGAFALGPTAGRIRGAAVLLVDDVVTTGSTARECAQTLRTAGVSDVYLAAAAVRL